MSATAIDTVAPLLRAAQDLDLTDPDTARAELERRFDPAGDEGRALAAELVRLCAAGEVAQNGELPLKWGRLAKASDKSLGFSVDVVLMSAPGPKHRHPEGEVNFCVRVDGQPTFDGREPGWVVLPPGSAHVPSVAGGTMLIVYMLPQGRIEFLEKPG